VANDALVSVSPDMFLQKCLLLHHSWSLFDVYFSLETVVVDAVPTFCVLFVLDRVLIHVNQLQFCFVFHSQ